jgi:AraC-like DNA-binding protein
MLLLDSTNLSVYEVAEETLSHWTHLPPPITFARFEATARSHVYGLFLAAHIPSFRVGAETLVFVRLAHERGWAWASRIRVAHHDQLPIKDVLIGEEFLFLWPVPMAINAYINFKEAARRSLALSEGAQETALVDFVSAVKAHPPTTAFLPQRFREHAVETVREVRAKDLTVPQRLFVASLMPHSTAFALRSPADKWAEKLHAQDQDQLDRFLQKHTAAPEIASSTGPTLRARARPQRQPQQHHHHHSQRRHRQRCVFDLPDDLVERILSIHLARSMADVEAMQNAVASARLVCRQFQRTTNASITRMIVAVTGAARSLLGVCPREPAEVQTIVHAAGLTLRHALTLQPPKWRSYVRRRRVLERYDRRVPHARVDVVARDRCALLWGISAA